MVMAPIRSWVLLWIMSHKILNFSASTSLIVSTLAEWSMINLSSQDAYWMTRSCNTQEDLNGNHQPETTKVLIVGEIMWTPVNPQIALISRPSSTVQLTIRQCMAASDMMTPWRWRCLSWGKISTWLIHLKRIYNFWCSMLVLTPFA
jgi:hypothetical protein